jgi:hypothetical protein
VILLGGKLWEDVDGNGNESRRKIGKSIYGSFGAKGQREGGIAMIFDYFNPDGFCNDDFHDLARTLINYCCLNSRM